MAPLLSRAPGGAFSGAVTEGAKAAERIFASLAYGEAPRWLIVGDTRVGKTYATNQLIGHYEQKSLGIVAVCDDKLPDRAQYAGQLYASPAELIDRPMLPAPRVLVFRGVEGQCDPDEIAAYCWALRERHRHSLLVIDESNHPLLTAYGMFRSGVEWVPKTFWQGGGAGIGALALAQSPQDAPLPMFEQSTGVVCFKTAGKGLRKLQQLDYADDNVARVIPTFHGPNDPPEKRGEFVVLERGKPWDEEVYRF